MQGASSMRDKFDPADLELLKSRYKLSSIFSQLGFKVKGRNPGVCLCPFHREKTPSCKVDDRRGTYKCFGCGEWGDHFDILMRMRGLHFLEAVAQLGGVRPATPEERKKIEQQKKKLDEEDAAAAEKARKRIAALWDRAEPVMGTDAEGYLSARGLIVNPYWTFDLRFAASIQYRGFKDADASEQTDLGSFPAMLAAIRDHEGNMIGLHRTYLEPGTQSKLYPPGDARRNAAKKVMGEQRGGIIRLSKVPGQFFAIGEGIETVRSWQVLNDKRGEYAIASAVSLGNLSGRATGSQPHPEYAGKYIPNGIPDLTQPGIVLPHVVTDVVLIGDGDSDRMMTRQRLSCAGERFKAQKKRVGVSMAPSGKDWNDVLMEEADA
jgi:hypothetical protein